MARSREHLNRQAMYGRVGMGGGGGGGDNTTRSDSSLNTGYINARIHPLLLKHTHHAMTPMTMIVLTDPL